ncbi:MAG: FG-GAP repeat domain-containing protein [Candidatus Bathyarchaeia archaeon]|jgi:acylphosphatase
MKAHWIFIFVVCGTLFAVAATPVLFAQQTGSLTVEHEQHWDTYMVGGTCIFATQNIHLADLDADGTIEIITGGYTYNMENQTRVQASAPLKIWNWNGQNLTLETNYKWPANQDAAAIVCVTSGDANVDGKLNLLTGGRMANQSGFYAQLRMWRWDCNELSLLTSREWNSTQGTSSVTAAVIIDADNDGNPEIFTAGRSFYSETNQTNAELRVWQWNNSELNLLKTFEWSSGNSSSANSIAAADVNKDGKIEVVTAGYSQELTNSSGQICIWQWNGTEFTLLENQEWQTQPNIYALTSAGGVQGNTVVNNVKVEDVDGDGVTEIVTGGFTYDGEKVNGQLRIWNLTGQTAMLEASQEWTSQYITEVKAITLNDVDKDGNIEVVTSGVTAGQTSFAENATSEMAQLRVWSWNGSEITLEHSVDWTVGEGVCAWNVASGDVDKDGVVEIITVGCMYVSNLCDPDMRIWSINQQSSPIPTEIVEHAATLQTELFAAAAISIVIIAGATVYLLKKREPK